MTVRSPLVLVPSSRGAAPRPVTAAKAPSAPSFLELDEGEAPLVATLAVNGAPPGSVGAAQAHATLVRHVLARDPVLVSAAGGVATVDAVHAYLNGLLRVRERMYRLEQEATRDQVRRLTDEDLRRLLGETSDAFVARESLGRGDVILVHEDQRVGHRRTVARVQQCLVPVAFRYAEAAAGTTAEHMSPWLAVLCGAPRNLSTWMRHRQREFTDSMQLS